MNKCSDCGADMAPLFTGEYCTAECDLEANHDSGVFISSGGGLALVCNGKEITRYSVRGSADGYVVYIYE